MASAATEATAIVDDDDDGGDDNVDELQRFKSEFQQQLSEMEAVNNPWYLLTVIIHNSGDVLKTGIRVRVAIPIVGIEPRTSSDIFTLLLIHHKSVGQKRFALSDMRLSPLTTYHLGLESRCAFQMLDRIVYVYNAEEADIRGYIMPHTFARDTISTLLDGLHHRGHRGLWGSEVTPSQCYCHFAQL
jgi:hypothetical protein